jgi:hypothetical protein
MKKQFNLLIASAFVLFLVSCQKEYKAPQSNVVGMSGKWWVELYFDGDQDGLVTADDLIYSYGDIGVPGIITTNVNSNAADSILMKDPDGADAIWPFKTKLGVDYANLTIKPSTGNPNLAIDGESVSVISGKILKNAATTLSGGKTDSIFVELEFSDDAGSYYVFTGHRRTGFPDDEH